MSLNVISGIVGVLVSSFGGLYFFIPAISDSKWGTPVLIGAIVLTVVLIAFQLVKMRRAPSYPPAVAEPPPAPPTMIQPPSPTMVQVPPPPPAVIQPPTPAPPVQAPPVVAPPSPPPVQPVIQPQIVVPPPAPQVSKPETLTFNSMEEFEKWLQANQIPTQQVTTRTPVQREKPWESRPQKPSKTPAPPVPPVRVPTPTVPAPTPTPAPSAPVSGSTGSSLTPAEAQEMVDAHNRRRTKYGTPPLIWDPEIARSAQSWTEQQAAMGRMQHSDGYWGENLSWAAGKKSTPENVLVGWSDEEAPCYDYASNSCSGCECLHHTQVVDKRSKKLGCGKVERGRETYWTCQYSPAGNLQGSRPY